MHRRMKVFIKSSFFDYSISIILTLTVLFVVYHLWEINIFETPFVYGGDGISGLASTKLLIEEGVFNFTSDRLGAPFGYSIYDGSQSTYLPLLLKKIPALFSSNWIFVMNFSYLLGFVMISCVALVVLKTFIYDRRVAVILSVLFSCTPFHFMRGEAHYGLSFYLSVPIAVYYIIRTMQGDILLKHRHYINWNNIIYFLSMVIIGIGGLYYAFFTCYFFCVAAVYIFMNEKTIKRLKEVLLSIVIITGTVIAGYIPTIIYTLKHGENTEGIVRATREIDIYGLKIAQLVLPITGHRIPLLAQFKDEFNRSYGANENDMASLGLVFLIGFIVLLLSIWKKDIDHKKTCLHELVCLNLAALLYASVGGFMSIQGVFFSMLRAGNRISIYISLFSCICVGILLTDFIKIKKISKKSACILLLCIFSVGIFDVTKENYVNKEMINRMVNNDRAFVEEVENLEKEGMVLQLPIMDFPENGNILKMGDYAHVVGYLYSDRLRWSYGTFRGRDGSNLLDEFKEDLFASEMVLKAARMGYTGIYINGDGYLEEDFAKLKSGLKSVLACEPVESSLGDKIYFSLKNYAKQNEIKNDYCSIEYGNGVFDQEENDEFAWRWIDQKSQFRIYSWSEKKQKVCLTMKVQSYWQEGGYRLTIKGKEESVFEIYPQETVCTAEIELEPGFNSFDMYTDAPLINAEGDDRNLCFMLTELKCLASDK